MTILEQVTAAREFHRTSGDKLAYTTLTGLKGDIENANRGKGGTLSEKQIAELVRLEIAQISTAVRKLRDSGLGFDDPSVVDLSQKAMVLGNFLPKQLTVDQIRAIIEEQKFDGIPAFRKYMKEHHDGHFDGQTANKIFLGQPLGFAELA